MTLMSYLSNFATWREASTQIRLLPSHRNLEIVGLASLKITLQTDGSQVLEKAFLDLKTGNKFN